MASLSQGFVFKKNSLPVFEAMVHGRQRLMVTEHPLLDTVLNEKMFENKSFSDSSRSVPLERYVLKDSRNFSFPVLSDTTGRCFIFNSKELNAYDLLPNLKAAGISVFRIDGIGHTPDEIFELVRLYKKELDECPTDAFYESHSKDGPEFTKGNFIRGIE
jgi:putative protease